VGDLFSPFLETAHPVLVFDLDGYVLLRSGPQDPLLVAGDNSLPQHHHRLPVFSRDSRCLLCKATQQVAAGELPVGGTLRPAVGSVIYTVAFTAVRVERTVHAIVGAFTRCVDFALSHQPSSIESDRRFNSGVTPREREVLMCLVQGMNARATGEYLGISHNTARNHMQNVLHKLDAHNKAEAVAQALKFGLLNPEDLQ
jgi:DNA-binding CsgD family transcriptional regulator